MRNCALCCLCLLVAVTGQALGGEKESLYGAYATGGYAVYSAVNEDWLGAGLGLVASGLLLSGRENQVRQRHRYEAEYYDSYKSGRVYYHKYAPSYGSYEGYSQGYKSYPREGYGHSGYSQNYGSNYGQSYGGYSQSRSGNYGLMPVMVNVTESATCYYNAQRGTITETRSVSRTVEYALKGAVLGSYSFASGY